MSTATAHGLCLEEAGRLLSRGTDCLGPAEIVSAFGDSLGLKLPGEIPPIPWTGAEIKAAKECDEGVMLVLMPPGLTMKQMVEARQNQGAGGGKLLYDTSWYQEELFFTTATTGNGWHWVMMTRTVIPVSTGKNFLEQTDAVARYLRDVVFVGRELPECYARAIAEFERQREEIARLMNLTDWQEAAKRLAMLKLNQMCRLNPAQFLFALAAYGAVNGECLLQGVWHWSSSLSSGDRLVSLGGLRRGGASVIGWRPVDSGDALGVAFSRSAVVEGGK